MAKKKINLEETVKILEEGIKNIDKLSDSEVVSMIVLLRDSGILAQLPRGNRDYLSKVLEVYQAHPERAHNYTAGAKKHLVKALPYQIGHILATQKEKIDVENVPKMYHEAAKNITNIDKLSPQALYGLMSEVENNPELSNVRAYQGSRKAVQLIMGKYERLAKEQGREEADRYLESKRESIKNIYQKSYLPNATGEWSRKGLHKKSRLESSLGAIFVLFIGSILIFALSSMKVTGFFIGENSTIPILSGISSFVFLIVLIILGIIMSRKRSFA